MAVSRYFGGGVVLGAVVAGFVVVAGLVPLGLFPNDPDGVPAGRAGAATPDCVLYASTPGLVIASDGPCHSTGPFGH